MAIGRGIRWGVGGLAIAGLAVLGFALIQGAPPERIVDAGEQPRLLSVATVTLEQENAYPVTRHYSGRVKARRDSALGFAAAGRVVSIAVREGEAVEQGAALAELDVRRLKARLAEAEAQREQASALLDELLAGPRHEAIQRARADVEDRQEQLELARLKRGRLESLVEQRAVPQDDFDEATSGERQAEARLEAAKNQLAELVAGTRDEQIRSQQASIDQLDAVLELLRVELSDSTLRAPFAGVIAERHVDEGVMVEAGQPIVRLSEVGTLEAHIGVPASMIEALSPGAPHTITLGACSVDGVLTEILPEVDRRTRTRTAVFRLSGSEAPIAPGEVARVALTRNRETSGYWVPATALIRGKRGLWACYALVEGEGTAPVLEQRYVEIIYGDEDRAYVRGTLHNGDRIVSDGAHRLVPGQAVSVAESPAEA